jgi:hypothetical protein
MLTINKATSYYLLFIIYYLLFIIYGEHNKKLIVLAKLKTLQQNLLRSFKFTQLYFLFMQYQANEY